MLPFRLIAVPLLAAVAAGTSMLATVVPNVVQMPGTQPNEITPIAGPDTCAGCHGYYGPESPLDGWEGSMMAHSARDPLFWAALAVAEQDFDGSGDLCLKCHTPSGWMAGESTPTNGESIAAHHDDGVSCAVCHRMADPDGQGLSGVQNAPFIANSGGANPEGFYGSGMMVLNFSGTRYGPYSNISPPHAWQASPFHRESQLCGTCHDVSNPVVGDLAANHGSMTGSLPAGSFAGTPGAPLGTQAAFNNPPHSYGVVERTFSEHQSSAFANLRISDYGTLPPELRGGVLEDARDAALLAGNNGDYSDGTPRTYSCQTCHMQPTVGRGCGIVSAPTRDDLPVHDLTGGNTWAPLAIMWLDAQGRLKLGGGLAPTTIANMQDGIQRARAMLQSAAALEYRNGRILVANRSGHKLFTGYPEGRRMWLNVKWFDGAGNLLREDGEYGDLNVSYRGRNFTVRTLLEPDHPRTRLYHVEPGITQDWAADLVALGTDPATPLTFDRVDGQPGMTLGQLAAQPAGTKAKSFHFVLNNTVMYDNRIPPYQFDYDMALERSALPVPPTLYGNPGPGGRYRHYDAVPTDPPPGAVSAEARLMYQTTSWEYVQFLFLANKRQDPFLASVGRDLIEAWFATGMAEPEEMALLQFQVP